jgi:hypothetical protein
MIDHKSKVNSFLDWGDWDKETARLDLDGMSLAEVKLWAFRATFWFKLEGFLILESSHKDYIVKQKGRIFYRFRKTSYHVVFNCPVDWSRNSHIMNWVALESGNENLKRWVIMQYIKETSTLRSSRDNKRPIPEIVFRYGLQDKQIKKFLETRKLILNFLKGER